MKFSQRIVATCLSALLAFQGLGFALPAYAASDDAVAAAEQNATAEASTDSIASTDNTSEQNAAAEMSSQPEETTSASAFNETGEDDSEEIQEYAISLAYDANASYDFKDIATLDEALTNGGHGSAVNTGGSVTITFNDSIGLKMISHADPLIYQTATIQKGGSTGTEISLCATSGETYAFQGFGSSDYPFEGKFYGSSSGTDSFTFVTDRTIFNALELTSNSDTMNVTWKGDTSYNCPMIATKLSGDGALTVNVGIADPTDATGIVEGSAALTAPLFGTSTATATVSAAYSFAGTRKALSVSATGNVSLLVNTVSYGTFTIGNVTGLDRVNDSGTIKTSSGNAGLFVGEVDAGAAVTFSSTADGGFTLSKNITVESAAGCAGGLVGLAGETTTATSTSTGSSVALTNALDLSNLTVKGTTASGGLIGKAVNLTLSQTDGATFTCPQNVGSTSSENSGGFIGDVSFSGEKTFTGNSEIVTSDTVDLSAKTNAGAVFGYLDLAHGSIAFQGTDDTSAAFKSALAENGGSVVYGGIAGRVVDTSATQIDSYWASIKTFTVSKVQVEGTCTKQARTAGGLVGSLGANSSNAYQCATLIVDNATVAWGVPWASFSFGGVVGCVDHYSVADIGDVSVSTTSEVSLGAGIAGETWVGTVYLHGTTDLSGLKLSGSAVGQIAITGTKNPSLIFAAGSGSDSNWTFKRPSAVAVDDLGGSGSSSQIILGHNEVVRLGSGGLSKDLIALDSTTHQPRFWLSSGTDSGKDAGGYAWGKQLTYDSSAQSVSVGSADEFACLAITIQTLGYFSGISGIGDSTIGNLASAIINVTGDINLAGTGITGLSQDAYYESGDSGAWVFSGTLNGGGHTVTLAVGEPYGQRGDDKIESTDTSEGNGKIYYHNRLGLFGQMAGATINDLTIAGTMNFDAKTNVDAGSLVAVVSGGTNAFASTKDVTASTVIAYKNSCGESNSLRLGGLIGRVSAASTLTLGGTGKASFTGSIASQEKESGNSIVGGVIGRVDDAATTVNAANVVVSGSIASNGSNLYALTGGFIGVVAGTNNTKTVDITGLSLDSLKISGVGNDAGKTAGGLLGYSWNKADVTFTGASSKYALTASGANLATGVATQVGGLVYAASGVWTVNNYAIDLSGATLSASDATKLGLLVCVGGSEVKVGGNNGFSDTLSGLYLKNTDNWSTAYKVNESVNAITAGNVSTFDEWVADTCKPDSSVTDSGVNGVVSLHTTGSALDMTGEAGSRNSYENRTALGKAHQANGSSRYYYNLDRMTAGNSDSIDSPEKLLLWSVYRYAATSLKSNFGEGNSSTSTTITGTLNMAGYSYYPVDVTGENVTVQNATIMFCNSKIEAEENGNKVTSDKAQHMNMHAGLLRNFSCGTSAATYTVSDVALAGSVGMDAEANTAGALLCGTMVGTPASSAIAKLDITNLTLDGLVVNDVADDTSLAPLVACNLGTYTSLDVAGVSVASGSYTGAAAATSLFGNLGGDGADQVTASFTNVAVPSLSSGDGKDAIFTHASFLESYSYKQGGSSSAVYTFTKADRDKQAATFGSEIDSAGEYAEKQLWYYDEALNGTDAGLVQDNQGTPITANKDNPQFGVYLPYVKKGKEGAAYHEIKVNQRIPNLVVGCGTYGDPYAITSANQLTAIANFINAGTVLDGWTITIAADQETLCTRRSDQSAVNEVTYQYSAFDSTWRAATFDSNTQTWSVDTTSDSLEDGLMRRYIQSCYLSIEPASSDSNAASSTLTVDTSSFNGLGNHDYPFRGVIVGNLASGASSSYATLAINNSEGKSFQGLISYSYGSVVRNLNIMYSGSANSVSYTSKNTTDGTPTAFFGGVIGCIMGGDNIVDGVTVSAQDGFSVSGGSHLVAIGGYVGAIAGGGVIFRNMTGSSWHASGTNLYDNPYVGRVIDGFAFSEGCTVDNGNDNYQVNELTDAGTACVTTTDIQGKYRDSGIDSAATVTISNAQGLLVLSAIINSGAAAGAAHSDWNGGGYGVFRGSRAYQGSSVTGSLPTSGYRFGNTEFGKVRNASYANVGSGSASSDFSTSVNDDIKAPGKQAYEGPLDNVESSSADINSPYLVSAYANAPTGYVCASKLTGVSLRFAENSTYDMTGYGTGFVGLSGRYYSNACYSGQKSTDRDRITPWVACIDGNGSTLTLNSAVREYKDDDYKVAGVGGLFSSIEFTSSNVGESISANDGANVRNITFKNCNASLTYVDSNNVAVSDYAGSGTGVGILAGVTASVNDQGSYGVYKNVSITADSNSPSKVAGAENAGGLYGSAGYASRSTSDSVSEMISLSGVCAPVKLYDCSYSNLSVTGRLNAGGFVGKVLSGASGVWVTSTDDKTIASDSIIAIDSASTDSSNTAGGVFGLVGCSVNVNTGQDASATQLAIMSNVKVTTEIAATSDSGCTRGVGSLVGRAENTVSTTRFAATSTNEASGDSPTYLGTVKDGQNVSTYSAAKNVGGIVGWSNKDVAITDCSVQKIRIASGEHSGGVAGTMDSGAALTVDGSKVSSMVFDGARMGGIVGNVANSGSNVTVKNSTVEGCSFSGKASYWASHPGTNGNFSGGIVGYALGTYNLSNVLLSQNTFADTAKRQGLLVGCTAQNSGDFKGLYAAGIDVKVAPGQTNSDVPAAICYFNESNGDKSTINKKSYIAFADYADAVDGTSGLYDATGVSPYVTTSPKSKVAVKDSKSTDVGYLSGDGAAITTAATIQSETKTGTSETGRYVYTNIGGIGSDGAYQNSNNYDAATSASTFNANNSDTSKQAATDFPVLQLSGNDTQTIANYLNLVTNGGFSDAVRLNGSTTHVSATTQTVTLSNGAFTVDDSASVTPTVSVLNNGTSNMSFRATSQWDNEKGQFTLLTVTFSEAGQTYKVQVPIIVKRMLEIDFTATYAYGTHFKASDYSSLGSNAHVLSNFGEPMTGYLTWTYNQAQGTSTEYGWDSHLASGASMGALGKTLFFDGSAGALPKGTQLTLVDADNGGKSYFYTVGDGGATKVKLAEFKDSSGIAYSEKWLSELMGVTASDDESGAWVACEAGDANVGAKVVTDRKTTYYRPYADSDTGDRYSLTVKKDNNGKEISPSENFYLVVNVPAGATSSAVNGFTSTLFEDSAINKHTNLMLRTGGTDGHENTASTYSIYSGYTQKLADNEASTNVTELLKTDDGTGYTFALAATDTISFDSSQQYNSSDKLYYQFGASLVSYSNDGTTTGASGFPTGTTGTLNFYVKVGDTYYKPTVSGGSTSWTAAASASVAATKSWSAKGADLAEALCDADGSLFDLSGIRTIAKDNGSSFQIIVELADIKMTEEAAKAAIAASQDGSSYTKVSYRSALSTREDTLSTSSMVAAAAGNPGFYRKDSGNSTIELTASVQSQLGINVSDLALADGTIAAVGTYSFLKLANGSSKIDQASAVRYTLSLQQRKDPAGGNYELVPIGDYLSVAQSSELRAEAVKDTDNKTTAITFTDPKTDGAFTTRDGDTDCFKFPFQVKVNTNVESASHIYANYRIVLTASLLDAKDSVIDTPVNALGAEGYKNSDYLTYSLTKVNVEGIPHSQTSTSTS